MENKNKLEGIFLKHRFKNFKWIDPKEIVTAQWVRMKCIFGCNEYGRNASCPPNAPDLQECERFFQEYSQAVVFHFEKAVDKPEDRHAWTKKINNKLLKLERDIFLSGFRKAFLLFLDSCGICDSCTEKRKDCKEPKLSRPTPEAMAVDVFTTVRSIGYPIEVLSDYSQKMNRYAFLFIE